jgi:hypothetical protein
MLPLNDLISLILYLLVEVRGIRLINSKLSFIVVPSLFLVGQKIHCIFRAHHLRSLRIFIELVRVRVRVESPVRFLPCQVPEFGGVLRQLAVIVTANHSDRHC